MVHPSLPSVAELRRRYSVFSKIYFDETLPVVNDVTIEWSTRMTSSAGLCQPVRKIIRLSVHYHLKYPEEVDHTLLHEMIHLIVPNHGRQFYAWMERIRSRGGKVSRFAKERATPAKYRWRYTCRCCGRSKRTRRRYARGGKHHRCALCKSGLIEQPLTDERGLGDVGGGDGTSEGDERR